MIVVAPTGIAAQCRRYFDSFPVSDSSLRFRSDRNAADEVLERGGYINQQTLARKHPLNSERKQVLRSIDLLVIDEMVCCEYRPPRRH